jgi:hypothetical protein
MLTIGAIKLHKSPVSEKSERKEKKKTLFNFCNWRQGDQTGQVFAYFGIVYFWAFFENYTRKLKSYFSMLNIVY